MLLNGWYCKYKRPRRGRLCVQWNMPDCGILTHVDPRTVWPREATDFTPWLAGNLGALGIALGMDLELVQREALVGAFSLDILARDLNRARAVVIENQLEATDHDHLGSAWAFTAQENAASGHCLKRKTIFGFRKIE